MHRLPGTPLLCTVLIAVCAVFLPADAAAECINYPDYFHRVSTEPTPSPAKNLALGDGLVFICSGAPGLMIYDVSDPTAPDLLTTLDTPGSCTDVAVLGDHVFVADGASGLQVVDISNPSNPEIVHTLTAGTISYLGLEGSRLAAVGGGQFHLIDVTNPLVPFVTGSVASVGSWDVALEGNLAFLGGGSMSIMDVSNPAAPVQVGLFDVTGWALGVDVMDHYVAVANYGAGFETAYNFLVDVSNPAAPTAVWTQYTYVGAWDVTFIGSVAFLFGDYGVLEAWDFSNPAAPTLMLRDFCEAGRLVADGNHLYLSGWDGLLLYDISPLELAPLAASFPDLPSNPAIMHVAGSRVYTAGRASGDPVIDLIDTSNPMSPVRLSAHWIGHYLADPTGIGVAGDFLYVALDKWSSSIYSQNGLAVVNISNPSAPLTVTLKATTKGGAGLALVGNYAYLGQKDSTIAIFNLQNPANPQFVTEFPIPGIAFGMTLVGSRLYIAADEMGMILLDVANPLAPSLLSVSDTPGYAISVTVDGTLAYVADTWGSVPIFDVSNPAAPALVESLVVSTGAYSVALGGDFAYVAGSDKVTVFSVADPAAPRMVGSQSGAYSYLESVAAVGEFIYACGRGDGLIVLRPQCTTTGVPGPGTGAAWRLRLSASWPNPSTGHVSATAHLPSPGFYTLAVFDLSGRVVRDLPPIETVHPGPVLVRWDGKDRNGSPASNGVYFLKLTDGTETALRKVVVNR